MPALQTFKQPVGIFRHMTSPQPETLRIKGEHFSDSFSVTGMRTGHTYLTITSESMSLSHRKHFVDTESGRLLFDLRKESMKLSGFHYCAENPEVKENYLFDIDIHSGFTGAKTTLNFTDPSGRPDTLFFKPDSAFSACNGTIFLGGKEKDGGIPVAEIKKDSMHLRSEYHVNVAPGMDPILVVALLMGVHDRQRTRQRTAAASGGGGGGGA